MLVVYTGEEKPPDAVLADARAHGVTLVPLLDGGGGQPDAPAEVLESLALRRLADLNPQGWVATNPFTAPPLTTALIDAAPNLGIACFSAPSVSREDYETYADFQRLDQRGIVITAAPGGTTVSVVEGTLALLLALSVDLVAADDRVRQGDDSIGPPRATLFGSTLGILGLGSIGARVARLATALGMRVIYHSPSRRWDLEDELGLGYVDLPDLFAGSDYISIHSAAARTRGLVDETVLSKARGLRLINTAAPGVVQPEALLRALEQGWVRAAAFDSVYREPYRSQLLALGPGRFIVMPWISWNTHHTRERCWRLILESLVAWKRGEPVPHQMRRA